MSTIRFPKGQMNEEMLQPAQGEVVIYQSDSGDTKSMSGLKTIPSG